MSVPSVPVRAPMLVALALLVGVAPAIGLGCKTAPAPTIDAGSADDDADPKAKKKKKSAGDDDDSTSDDDDSTKKKKKKSADDDDNTAGVDAAVADVGTDAKTAATTTASHKPGTGPKPTTSPTNPFGFPTTITIPSTLPTVPGIPTFPPPQPTK